MVVDTLGARGDIRPQVGQRGWKRPADAEPRPRAARCGLAWGNTRRVVRVARRPTGGIDARHDGKVERHVTPRSQRLLDAFDQLPVTVQWLEQGKTGRAAGSSNPTLVMRGQSGSAGSGDEEFAT